MAVRVTLTFPMGSVVRFEAEFTDADGLPVDPTTVKLRYMPPSNTEGVLEFGAAVMESVGPGLYRVDVVVDEPGLWRYRWEGTGTGQAVEEAAFKVAASVFA